MRILAVDDDPIFLDLLVLQLHAIGLNQVTLAASPADALHLLERETPPFDCILTDMQMPGMDGADLCRLIRNKATYRQVPIVMVTSLGDRSQIDRAFAMGATDYITKPIDASELKARMLAVARLAAEQEKSRRLEQQMLAQTRTQPAHLAFDDAILVPEFDRGIEYIALQNYLLTLGLKGLFTVAAGAICIDNAALLYRMTDADGFRAMLSDVGAVIEDVLKPVPILMSYTGSGQFVGILTGPGEWDAAALETELTDEMEDYAPLYHADRLPLPRLRVGPVVRNAFYAPTRPLRILERAIAAAGGGKAQRARAPLSGLA